VKWLKGKEAREEYHALLEEELASWGLSRIHSGFRRFAA
jgi:hypothetical protein